jgi:hypothetical protein
LKEWFASVWEYWPDLGRARLPQDRASARNVRYRTEVAA